MSEPRLPDPLPILQSWRFLPVGVVLFALTVAFGFVAKSLGAAGPDLAVEVELGEGRTPMLSAGSLIIHFLLGPLGSLTIVVAVCAWLMWVAREPLKSLAFGSVVAVGWLGSETGKRVVARLRPPANVVHALVLQPGADSFPSGHTAFAASLSLSVVLVLARGRKQRLTAVVAGVLFTAITAVSRMYLGVHYPTDVIGSLLIVTAAVLIWLPVWGNLVFPRLSRSAPLLRLAESGC